MKTNQEIRLMIERLEEEKETIPEFSFFGDNNWQMYDTAIRSLKERWSESDLNLQEFEDDQEESLAFSAVQWLDGKIDDEEFLNG